MLSSLTFLHSFTKGDAIENEYPNPETTRNVLMTETNDEGDNVMISTTLTAVEITKIYKAAGTKFSECYEVKGEDLQYYLYEPCLLTLKEEAEGRRRLEKMRQQRMNLRNAYLIEDVSTIRDGMKRQDQYGKECLQEMIDECKEAGVDNYGKVPL